MELIKNIKIMTEKYIKVIIQKNKLIMKDRWMNTFMFIL